MENFTVVVAKYKEDVSWSKCFEGNLKIYNKGPDGDITNVGREGETFLRYIIEHYDNLPEVVVFLQGDPFGHMPPDVNKNTICDKIKSKRFDNPNWKIEPCFGIWLQEQIFQNIGLLCYEYYKYFFGKEYDGTINYIAGCQYYIRRNAILQNPKELYEKLQRMLVKGSEKYENNHNQAHAGPNSFDDTLISGWTLERLWYYFFV